MEVVRFKRGHLEQIDESEGRTARLKDRLDADELETLEKSKRAFTALDGDDPVLIGGLTEYWPGRAEAWLVFKKDMTHKMPAAAKVVKQFLDDTPMRRVEAICEVDDYKAMRWLRTIGFHLEVERLQKFSRHGADCAMFVRLDNGY